jgi:ClpP class serine protease
VRSDENGCRPAQLFGLWAIEPGAFESLVAQAKILDLDKLHAEAAAKQAQPQLVEDPLYRLTQDGVAVISLSGPMTKYPTSFQAVLGGTSTVRARQALREASRADNVSGIMLIVDSPGGTTAGTAELANDVRLAALRKPLAAYVDDMAGSAALWATAQAPFVTASRGAEIGSIGAFAVLQDTSGQAAQAGVKVHVISSAPPLKGAGVAGTEITDEQLAEYARRMKDVGENFASEVALGRGDRLAGTGTPMERVRSIHTGQMWLASKAKELGLIDAVGSLDDAMASLRRKIMQDTETKDALAMAAEQEQQKLVAEKALAEETAKRSALEKALAEAQAQLSETQRAARAKEFAAKAEELGCTKAFAEVLERIDAAVGEDTFKALLVQLAAFSAQVEAGDLFKEKGSSAHGDNSATAWDQIQAKAAERVKAGTSKTLADAVSAVCNENKDLYKLHVEEQRKGVR